MNQIEMSEPKENGYETLWKMSKTLWKSITLEEYEEAIKEEGYEDFYMRVKIGLKDLEWMKKKYGGDGKGRLRQLYKQHQSGELDKQIDKRLDRLNGLKNRYEGFLQSLNDSTHNQNNKLKDLVK